MNLHKKFEKIIVESLNVSQHKTLSLGISIAALRCQLTVLDYLNETLKQTKELTETALQEESIALRQRLFKPISFGKELDKRVEVLGNTIFIDQKSYSIYSIINMLLNKDYSILNETDLKTVNQVIENEL